MYEQRHDSELDRVDDLFLPDAPEADEESPDGASLVVAQDPDHDSELEGWNEPPEQELPSEGEGDQGGQEQFEGGGADQGDGDAPEAAENPESQLEPAQEAPNPDLQGDEHHDSALPLEVVEPAQAVPGQANLLGPDAQPEIERRPMPVGEILAIVNQKGGVGKTTTTINLGAGLVEHGARVLLVDFDPQGALSVGLGLEPNDLDLTVHNLLFDKDLDIDQVIYKSKVEGLDIIPSNIDLSVAEMILVSEVARETTLGRCLEPIRSRYNYILIDCPPSLGLLTVNALTAAHAVVIPLECEYFALRGMKLLSDTVQMIQERLNPQLEIKGIVATMFDARTIHGREVLSRVTDAFGEKLFKTMIHKTIRFAEAPVAGEPILTYAPRSAGAQEYRDLAREVMSR
ncbi:MAG TPA: ParA family protein [Actinomycetota bacterium]|nr:ParA family protein [Actinomycetota bacterium]